MCVLCIKVSRVKMEKFHELLQRLMDSEALMRTMAQGSLQARDDQLCWSGTRFYLHTGMADADNLHFTTSMSNSSDMETGWRSALSFLWCITCTEKLFNISQESEPKICILFLQKYPLFFPFRGKFYVLELRGSQSLTEGLYPMDLSTNNHAIIYLFRWD